MTARPMILGLSGTTREESSSERILRACLAPLERQGASVRGLYGQDLMLPIYEPGASVSSERAQVLLAAVRDCDGVIICSPGYHGAVSGMIKNALDYLEDLRTDRRPYLEGRAVGCVGCAAGWQAAASALTGLRSIVHALRGWPTPLGLSINTAGLEGCATLPDKVQLQLETMSIQVLEHAEMRGRFLGERAHAESGLLQVEQVA